jgi:hypothetical protein
MIEKLREELIKDIISYLDEVAPSLSKWDIDGKGGKYHLQNNITQIIVDTFDELEWSMNTNGNVELKNK